MKWSPVHIDLLRKHYATHSRTELAQMFGCTPKAISSVAKRLKIKKREFWTNEQINYLVSSYPDTKTEVIAKQLGKTVSSVYGKADLMKLKKSKAFMQSELSGRLTPLSVAGLNTRFKKGTAPINKGKKQSDYMSAQAIERTKATRFKKGQIPHNTKQDGVIVVRMCKGRPYQYIRVCMGVWKELHRYLWRKHYGNIPHGYNVQFKDGNTLNCDISNMYLIKRKDQMKKNSIQRFPPEVKKAIKALSKLKRKIKHYEKQD